MSFWQKKIRFEIFLSLSFLLLIVSPILYCGFNFFWGLWSLKQIEKSFAKNDFNDLKTKSVWASQSFKNTRKVFFWGQPVFQFLGMKKQTDKLEKLILLGELTTESLNLSLETLEKGSGLFSAVLHGETVDIRGSSREIKIDLAAVFEKISLGQSLLNDFSGKEIFVGSFLSRLKEEIPQLRSLLWQSQELVEVLPQILAVENRKTYLLLFQNNMELRPGGGFIGSYGLLTFNRGRLEDLEIQDIYFADGQLRGHVEPPEKLKEFLGQAGWYLRDSNWDPDFPTNAARAEWFLEKETGRQVEGVFAFNLFVIERLLGVFGEVRVPDYEETITAKNFFERAQFRSEIGFFPGSTAKKDFLSAVALALFERMKTASLPETIKIGSSFYQSLQEKDILISVHDEKAMRVISKFNWDGSLRKTKCQEDKEGCFEDYLMIVEANVGINKVNYYLTRQISLTTQVKTEEAIEKSLILAYHNQSPSEVFPAGPYKNYLRLYVLQESLLEECQIRQEGETVSQEECRPEETFEYGKKVFGFLVLIPAGEKREVVLKWTIPIHSPWSWYRLFWQKQSGARNDFVNFSINSQTQGLTGSPPVYYNTSLSQDRIFDFQLKKKE